MRHEDFPLFAWSPTVEIIPFPSRSRIGHAQKIARQLSKARTNREADYVLSRAVQTHCRQMRQAGLSRKEIERQRLDFLELIDAQCHSLNARWYPEITRVSEATEPGGSA